MVFKKKKHFFLSKSQELKLSDLFLALLLQSVSPFCGGHPLLSVEFKIVPVFLTSLAAQKKFRLKRVCFCFLEF